MPTMRTLATRIVAVAALAATLIAAMAGAPDIAGASEALEGGIPLGAATAALVMTAAGRRIGATGRWSRVRLRLSLSTGWILAAAIVMRRLIDVAHVSPVDLVSSVLGG